MVIALLCVTAWIEYTHEELFWAFLLATAAFIFSATAVYNRLRPK